jgi:hypothetical protein
MMRPWRAAVVSGRLASEDRSLSASASEDRRDEDRSECAAAVDGTARARTGAKPGRAAVVIAASLTTVLAGCGTTIPGNPVAAGQGGSDTGTNYTKLLSECDLVDDKGIMDAVGGDGIERGFFGAICRWDVSGPGGFIKVSFNWYETGTMSNERATNEKLKYPMTNISVKGQQAIRIQRTGDPDSCGVTLSAPDTGVIGWWVQYRPGSAHKDVCAAATTLAELSVNISR